MDVRETIAKLQKTRKRRLQINDSSDLNELQPEANHDEENEESYAANHIKFEQGITQRGAISLWHAGYRYVKSKNIHWRCSELGCQATAKAEEKDGQFLGTLGRKEHNHPPAIQKKSCEEIRNKLKKDTRPILGEVRANIPDEVYIGLGSDDALNQLIKRQKKKKFGNVNCVDLGKMVIPAFLTQKYNSSTLIYDSRNERGNEDVVLVFSHARLLEILSQNKNWAIDGTFKCAPKPFLQCFCVGAFVRVGAFVCFSTPIHRESTAPPTPSISLSTIVEIPRWEMPLVQSPQYPIVFWNVNARALKALAKTNNALESSHYHFVKKT